MEAKGAILFSKGFQQIPQALKPVVDIKYSGSDVILTEVLK